MIVTSSGLTDTIFHDAYGARGSQFNDFGKCTYSIPFEIVDAPKHTKSFAFVFEDYDAVPLCGFSWIHWIGCNLTRSTILANESVAARDFVQGSNSWISPLAGSHSREESSVYGGMAPPNGPHLYQLQVFALDTLLPLERGFYLNEMYKALENHILEQAVLKGIY